MKLLGQVKNIEGNTITLLSYTSWKSNQLRTLSSSLDLSDLSINNMIEYEYIDNELTKYRKVNV